MSLRINRRNNFLEIKEGSNLKIFRAPTRDPNQIPDHDFAYHLGYHNGNNYGLSSNPQFHVNSDSEYYSSSALKFNGTEFLESKEINLLNKNSFSISTWVNTESELEEFLVTDVDSSGDGSFYLKSNNASGRPEFGIYNGVNEFAYVTGNSGINDGDWHLININFSCDKPNEEVSIELYIDSFLQESKSLSGILHLDSLSGNGLWETRKLEASKLTDDDQTSYIEMTNSQEESDLYFAEPITGGIDKIRYRAINDEANFGEIKTSLILKNKDTSEISTWELQSFKSSNFDNQKAISNPTPLYFGQTPFPPPIPEKGISYGPVESVFTAGCPSECLSYDNSLKTWFPIQDYSISSPHASRVIINIPTIKQYVYAGSPKITIQAGGVFTIYSSHINSSTTLNVIFLPIGSTPSLTVNETTNTIDISYPKRNSYFSSTDPALVDILNFINNQDNFTATTTATTYYKNQPMRGLNDGSYQATDETESTNPQAHYPLRAEDARDYETNSSGDVINHEEQYIYANFNTWQTEAPFLYGHDWDSANFTNYEILGIRYHYSSELSNSSTNGMTFSRIIEFGLYLNNTEYDLWTFLPLNNFSGLTSNINNQNNFTIGSSSSNNKEKFYKGEIDQLIIFDKTISQDEINFLYNNNRDNVSYSKELAEDMKVISWYDFANSEIVGWDRHYRKSEKNVARLYHLNNTRKDSSSYAVLPEEFGDIQYSNDVFKFSDYSAYFDGETYLFDEGGKELSFHGNFTIDVFLNFAQIPGADRQELLRTNHFKKTGTSLSIYFQNNRLYFDMYLGLKQFMFIESNELDISTDIFFHVAICRDRENVYLFFDRKICGQASFPYYLPIDNASEGLYIFNEFNGYAQDFRIITEACLYQPEKDIDEFTNRLSSEFYERNILTTTSHYPITKKVEFNDSDGIYIPSKHFIETAHDHKAFNFHKNSFSIIGWFRLENLIKSGFILGSWNDEGGNSHSYAIRYVKNFRDQVNTLVFLASEDGTNFRSVRTIKLKNNIMRSDRWYFFAVTYDTNTQKLKFFLYDQLSFIDSSEGLVNQFFTISRRDDFQINGVKHTEESDTFLDMSLSQLFFLNKPASLAEIESFWNSGGGIKYKESIDLNRYVIAWFDFPEGSLLDLHNQNHLTSSTAFTITEGRRKLEAKDDEAEIFLVKPTIGNNILFNLAEHRPTYETNGINNLHSLQFDQTKTPFLDSNFTLNFNTDFSFYFCFKSSGTNSEFRPIVDFSNSATQGLSVLWKDTPESNYPGILKLIVNNQELVFENEPFIRDINVVNIEWNRKKERVFLSLNNSRLSSAPKSLKNTAIHLNFSQTPMSLGKFYYDSENELGNFNGFLSEILYHYGLAQVETLQYFSDKYNAIHPGTSPEYIYDDDEPAIFFNVSQIKQYIQEGTSYLGRIQCSLSNPIYSTIENSNITINENGDIYLISPADRDIDSYQYTVITSDQDSDIEQSMSFITYVQKDTVIATVDTSNIKTFLADNETSKGTDLGCLSANESVTWSTQDSLITINPYSGCITLNEDIPPGTESIDFTVSTLDTEENITSSTITLTIYNPIRSSELIFKSSYPSPTIELDYILEPGQEYIEVDFNDGLGYRLVHYNNLTSPIPSNFSTANIFHKNSQIYSNYLNSNYWNDFNKSIPLISLQDIAYHEYEENSFEQESRVKSYQFINNWQESDVPESENLYQTFKFSDINHSDFSNAQNIINNLSYKIDRQYLEDEDNINYNDRLVWRRIRFTLSSNHYFKIRGKFISLNARRYGYNEGVDTGSENLAELTLIADEDSVLQKTSFNGFDISNLTLNIETDQLVDLTKFLQGCRIADISIINFNTSNVLCMSNFASRMYSKNTVDPSDSSRSLLPIKNLIQNDIDFSNVLTIDRFLYDSHDFTYSSQFNATLINGYQETDVTSCEENWDQWLLDNNSNHEHDINLSQADFSNLLSMSESFRGWCSNFQVIFDTQTTKTYTKVKNMYRCFSECQIGIHPILSNIVKFVSLSNYNHSSIYPTQQKIVSSLSYRSSEYATDYSYSSYRSERDNYFFFEYSDERVIKTTYGDTGTIIHNNKVYSNSANHYLPELQVTPVLIPFFTKTTVDLSLFTNGLKDISYLFREFYSFSDINFTNQLKSTNFSEVIDIKKLFTSSFLIQNITFPNNSNLAPSNIKDSSAMFSECYTLKNVNNFEYMSIPNSESCENMFYYCVDLKSIKIPHLNKVKSLHRMFYHCINLSLIEGSTDAFGYGGPNSTGLIDLEDGSECFYKNEKLKTLNLSNITSTKLSNINKMFYGCRRLSSIYIGETYVNEGSASNSDKNFYLGNVTTANLAFFQCEFLRWFCRKGENIFDIERINLQNCSSAVGIFRYCFRPLFLDLQDVILNPLRSTNTYDYPNDIGKFLQPISFWDFSQSLEDNLLEACTYPDKYSELVDYFFQEQDLLDSGDFDLASKPPVFKKGTEVSNFPQAEIEGLVDKGDFNIEIILAHNSSFDLRYIKAIISPNYEHYDLFLNSLTDGTSINTVRIFWTYSTHPNESSILTNHFGTSAITPYEFFIAQGGNYEGELCIFIKDRNSTVQDIIEANRGPGIKFETLLDVEADPIGTLDLDGSPQYSSGSLSNSSNSSYISANYAIKPWFTYRSNLILDLNENSGINLANAFRNCTLIENVFIKGSSAKINNFSGAFGHNTSLRYCDTSSINFLDNYTSESAFFNCLNLRQVNLGSNFLPQNNQNRNLRSMFMYCDFLVKIDNDCADWYGPNLKTIENLFNRCSLLKQINLSNLSPVKCKYMDFAFLSCTSLESLDLTNFNSHKLQSLKSAFSHLSLKSYSGLLNYYYNPSALRLNYLPSAKIIPYTIAYEDILYNSNTNTSVFFSNSYLNMLREGDRFTELFSCASKFGPLKFEIPELHNISSTRVDLDLSSLDLSNVRDATSLDSLDGSLGYSSSYVRYGIARNPDDTFDIEALHSRGLWRHDDYNYISENTLTINSEGEITSIEEPLYISNYNSNYEDNLDHQNYLTYTYGTLYTLSLNPRATEMNPYDREATTDDIINSASDPDLEYQSTEKGFNAGNGARMNDSRGYNNDRHPETTLLSNGSNALSNLFYNSKINNLKIGGSFEIPNIEPTLKTYDYGHGINFNSDADNFFNFEKNSNDPSYAASNPYFSDENHSNKWSTSVRGVRAPSPLSMFRSSYINNLEISNNFLQSCEKSYALTAMFYMANISSSTGLDFTKLKTDSAIYMDQLFFGYNGTNINTSTFKTSKAVTIKNLFYNIYNIFNHNIITTSWDTSNVKNFEHAFAWPATTGGSNQTEVDSILSTFEINLSGLSFNSAELIRGIFWYNNINYMILPTNNLLRPSSRKIFTLNNVFANSGRFGSSTPYSFALPHSNEDILTKVNAFLSFLEPGLTNRISLNSAFNALTPGNQQTTEDNPTYGYYNTDNSSRRSQPYILDLTPIVGKSITSLYSTFLTYFGGQLAKSPFITSITNIENLSFDEEVDAYDLFSALRRVHPDLAMNLSSWCLPNVDYTESDFFDQNNIHNSPQAPIYSFVVSDSQGGYHEKSSAANAGVTLPNFGEPCA